MKEKKHLIALDCGNSSYRVVLGTYENSKLNIEVLAQEKNSMVKMNGYYYWDIMKMYNFLIVQLQKCVQKGIEPDGIGVCTWGVDFGYYDDEGFTLGDVLSYRNTLGQEISDSLTSEEQVNLFNYTGIYCDRINSVYMMSALNEIMPSRTKAAKHILMIPDIMNYLLTGVMVNEPSELSTSQLMDVRTKKINKETCEFFGIPMDWFSTIGEHGTLIGNLQGSIKDEIGIKKDIPIICVPSHDTASAVAAIPTQEEEFLFISSGTWALIGMELDEPIINDVVFNNGLTNEVGAFGKITLLKNSTGMFILEKVKAEYEEQLNTSISWEKFLDMTKDLKWNSKSEWTINVDDERFFNPANMTKEIQKVSEELSFNKQLDIGELLYMVQYSMAKNYSNILNKLELVAKKEYKKVYMVGGGTKNKRINKMTAKISNKIVITCGDESTCLGNLGVQLKYFYPELNLKGIREIIGNSIEMKSY